MFFMAALNLRTSMRNTFDRLFGAQKYDMTLDLDQMYPADKIDRALRGVPGVVASEDWIVSDGWVQQQDGSAEKSTKSNPVANASSPNGEGFGNRFKVVAMPPDSRMLVPVMAQGRSLQAGDTDSVVLNSTMAAQNPQIKVGDRFWLRIGSESRSWYVAGICREPMRPPPIAYVPLSAVLHPGMANSIQVALRDSERASLELVRQEIDPKLEREGIRVSGGGSKAEFRIAVDEHVLMIYVFLVLASCVVGGVGGLGLTTTMGINILERRREIGVLRAVGATPTMVSAIVIGEAVTVAMIAWGIAALLGVAFAKALASMLGGFLHTGFDVSIAPLGIVLSLGASIVLAILASVMAAASAVRLTVREALAHE
jgi:putative ABC transport system permease protein